MKPLFCLCFIVPTLYFSGCTVCSTKKVTCPAFDDPHFFTWMPYDDSTTLVFKNITTADTFSYSISQKNISASYEITTGGFRTSPPQQCIANAYLASTDYSNTGFGTLRIYYDVSKDAGINRLELIFNNATWNAGAINDSSIQPIVNSGYEAAAITKERNIVFDNGVRYAELVTLENDTSFNKTERAYKLFIAKNIGIVGCEMFPSKQKWVIQ